jgi:hypothetical protein
MTTTFPPPLSPPRLATHCSFPDNPFIPTKHDWAMMHLAYAKTMHKQVSAEALHGNGFRVPHEVKNDPIRGRAVFATQPIKKGTRIPTWERLIARFYTKDQLVDFLLQLPSEQLQCDIMLWAYPTHGKVNVDLDANSFINHAETKEELTVDNNERAKRDIAAGEMLLMNYTKFIEYNSVHWFDEMRSAMWNDGEEETISMYEDTSGYNRIGAPRVDDTKTQMELMPEEEISMTPPAANHNATFSGILFLLVVYICYVVHLEAVRWSHTKKARRV